MSRKPPMSNAKRSEKQPFLTDVKTLRERARQHIAGGAVTDGYGGDTETAVKVLNTALATEIICVLRYKRHYFMARGIHSGPVAASRVRRADARVNACRCKRAGRRCRAYKTLMTQWCCAARQGGPP